jgi:1-deoxy-D-xylulose-5-phosphate reductoisomerase
VRPLDLCDIARLDFAAPDHARFPCLPLAEAAARAGGTAPAILNAANEMAVSAFLEHRVQFTQISGIIEHALTAVRVSADTGLAAALDADRRARESAEPYIIALAARGRGAMQHD